ncbi:MAG: HEAT repeat domain-containing protein [Nitrososphaerota archaeon]|nr:HEAT repeat domain-containing protein [Nitrososphaerota archaeon]
MNESGCSASSLKAFPVSGSVRHYPPDRPFELQHIALEIRPDFERRRIEGSATLTLRARREGPSSLALDLRDMTVRSVSQKGKGALAFSHTDGRLVVEPSSRGGEAFDVVVAYEGSPRKGLYFRVPDKDKPDRPTQLWTQGEDEDSRFWFPCIDAPVQKVTSEVTATVPASMTAISNGRLEGVVQERGMKTFHWVQDEPHSVYLVSLVAGEYVEMKEDAGGVPLYYYVYRGREEDAKRSFGETPAIMKFFVERTGMPYPWAKYSQTVVNEFIFGGMENTSCTTLTDTTLHDERAHLDMSSTPLVAHELAHQWFGDLLTCRHWSHAWLNEGFATYFDALYTEESKGRDEFVYTMMGNLDAYVEEMERHYARPIVTNVYETATELFDRHLYQKGSLVLNMVRARLGDEDFWRSMRAYVKDNAFGSVETSDLARAVEKTTGASLDGFFEQWVGRPGHPVLSVTYSSEDGSVAVVRVQQKQEEEAFRFQLKVLLRYDSGPETRLLDVTEKDQSFVVPLRSKPLFVTVDPEFELLKTLEFQRPREMMLRQLESDGVAGRVQAARGLARDGGLDAVDALKKALGGDPFWGVRAAAAKALADIGTDAALQALLDVKVEHPKARRAVMASLGRFRKEEAAAALSAVLKKGDGSYFVEAESARGLGRTKVAAHYDVLVGALSRPSWQEVVQVGAIDGLAAMGDERALPLVKARTARSLPPQVRQAAAAALGKLGAGKQDVYELLVDLLKDPWFRVRSSAADALVELKEVRAIPAIDGAAAAELDGRVKRALREAVNALRSVASSGGQELRQVRDELEKLKEENRALKERVEKLEKLSRKPARAKRA